MGLWKGQIVGVFWRQKFSQLSASAIVMTFISKIVTVVSESARN